MNKAVAVLRSERKELAEAIALLSVKYAIFPDSLTCSAARDRMAQIDMELAELEREEADRPDADGEFEDAAPLLPGFGEMC